MSMSPCPCLHVRVSMSMSPSLHVSMSPFLHVSMSLFYVSMFPCSISMSPCFRFRKQKTELTENGNLRCFAANGKRKQQTSVCLLQAETENRSLFSLVGKGNQRLLFQQPRPSMIICWELCAVGQASNYQNIGLKFAGVERLRRS